MSRANGICAVLGNAANQRRNHESGASDRARWLLLTIPNGYEAGEIVASAREKSPGYRDNARAH